jgi:hypothetical protein
MPGMENTKAFLAKQALIPGKLSIPITKIPPKMLMDMLSYCGKRGGRETATISIKCRILTNDIEKKGNKHIIFYYTIYTNKLEFSLFAV